jgi:ankyrin repeat protein
MGDPLSLYRSLTLFCRFRWIVCQLDALRECLARNVPEVLSKLPESLDETYERVLRGISKSNRKDVCRLLQCLVVATRPLLVEELAEVLAVDFDSDEEIPKLNPDWRWEDEEEALLTACSSLIAIVDTDESRVVQFSHFSVKEYLTSPRLVESSGDVSCYHIPLGPAHATLARACVGVLLQLDGSISGDNTRTESPLAYYAAEYWVGHAKFGDVSSCIQKAMEELFNTDKPHFVAWVQLYDMDMIFGAPIRMTRFAISRERDGTPLYYAALCGFHDLAKHLIISHPQYTNSIGGRYLVPLVVALARNDLQMAELLYQHGADMDVRGNDERTALTYASEEGHLDTVWWLLNHGADPNAREKAGWTSLHDAVLSNSLEVARLLLDHNANIEAQTARGRTPLHLASRDGYLDIVRLLLSRGAKVNPRTNGQFTPLHLAARDGNLEAARVLLEHGADVDAREDEDRTAFDIASSNGHHDIVKLLSEYYTK